MRLRRIALSKAAMSAAPHPLAESLRTAWRLVRKSSGAPGIDGQRISDFGSQLDTNLDRLADQLTAGKYVFSRLRATCVQKRSGGIRRLEIPTVRDRVVLQSMRLCVEKHWEPKMSDASHAFRSSRGAHTAIRQIRSALRRQQWAILSADIQAFFPSIVHQRMTKRLAAGCTLPDSSLYSKAIRLSSSRLGRRRGIAQGSPLSPLLSNVYMTDFDHQQAESAGAYVRYCDDMVFLLDHSAVATKRMRQIKRQLSKLGLHLNREKTFLVDCRKASFDYLGFRITADAIAASPASIDRIKRELEHWFGPSKIKRQKRLDHINGLLRSFAWYFSVADDKTVFGAIDQHVKFLRQRASASGRHRIVPSPRQLVRIGNARSPGPSKSVRGRARWNGYSH